MAHRYRRRCQPAGGDQRKAADSGSVVGVLLQGAASNQAVLAGALSGPIRYLVPAAETAHLVTGSKPNTGYAVAVTAQSGKLTIDIDTGTGFTTTAAGVLAFHTSAAGTL